MISPYPSRRLDDNLRLHAEASSDHPALNFYGGCITYGALWQKVSALAGFLINRLGVQPGDRVAVDMQNSPAYIVAYYAVLRAEAVVVPLNPMYRAEEVGAILGDAGVAVALVGEELLDRFSGWVGSENVHLIVARYADDLPELPDTAVPAFFHEPRRDLAADPRLIPFAEALATPFDPPAHVTDDGPAVMPYTSGSTGTPKGCPHHHSSVMHTAAAQADWYRFSPDSVITAVQPLFHVAGMQGSMNGGIYAGGTLLVMSRWDAQAAMVLFAKHGVTFWNAPPTMVVDLLSQDNLDEAAFERMTIITGGGAAMPVAVADRLKSRFGLHYIEGYGMTETMSPTHINPLEAPKRGSIGVPIQNTVACVIDPETQQLLPDGEVGEIAVAGPQVINGYWGDPSRNADAFATIDGLRMLRTGDLGYRDADGYYYIVDRLKRMINASGFKVWPTEVEGVVYGHEAVETCCVVASPDSYRGETVKVFIKLRSGTALTGEELTDWLRPRLAAFKLPRKIAFVESLPMTASHKVDWRVLQNMEKEAAPAPR